jgi:hypothetical protein
MNAFLPSAWRPALSALLPADAPTYHGPALARWLTGAYLLVLTARSLVHVFAAEGGAHSIATIDTSVTGGRNIIAIFGQWGAIQLVLAALLWVLLLRYRGLLPMILCVLVCEPFARALAGRLKPIETLGTAPGVALNWVAAPILALVLYLSLCPADAVAG